MVHHIYGSFHKGVTVNFLYKTHYNNIMREKMKHFNHINTKRKSKKMWLRPAALLETGRRGYIVEYEGKVVYTAYDRGAS